MTPVNRILMLKGVPLLRDLPPLNRVPGFRGIANVRQIDFPDAGLCKAGGGLRGRESDLPHAEPSGVLHRLDD